eukprot:m.419334 g.419334  ORF g.419334 m.419334 type:complete len:593 (-) comp21303_c1_seq6:220-1998(-)
MSHSGTPPNSEDPIGEHGTVDLDLTLSPGQSTIVVKDSQISNCINNTVDNSPTASETILDPEAVDHTDLEKTTMEQGEVAPVDSNVETTESASTSESTGSNLATAETENTDNHEGTDDQSGGERQSSKDTAEKQVKAEEGTPAASVTEQRAASLDDAESATPEITEDADVACLNVDSETADAPSAEDEIMDTPRVSTDSQVLSVGSSTDLIVDTSALMTSPPTPSVIFDDTDDTTPASEDFASTTRFGPENSRTVHNLPTNMEVRGDYRRNAESTNMAAANNADSPPPSESADRTSTSKNTDEGANGKIPAGPSEGEAPGEPARWAYPTARAGPEPLPPLGRNSSENPIGDTPKEHSTDVVVKGFFAPMFVPLRSNAVDAILKNLQTEKFDVKQLDMSPYQQEKTVKIANRRVKVGISIKEATNNALLPGAVVTHILPGSPASKCPDLTVGDLIIKVNGTSLIGLPFVKRLVVLRDTKKHAETELTIVQTQKVYNHTMSVTKGGDRLSSLGDRDYALGMTLRDNLIISAVAGSIAGDAGIPPSHYLLQVNNTSVVTFSTEELVDLFMKLSGEVRVITMPAYIYDAQILGRGR